MHQTKDENFLGRTLQLFFFELKNVLRRGHGSWFVHPDTGVRLRAACDPLILLVLLMPSQRQSTSAASKVEGAPDGPSQAWASQGTDDEWEGESRLQQQRTAIGLQQLYHWCATVFLLTAAQVVSDALHHKFRESPSPSELWAGVLLLYPVAAAAAVRYSARARPYAAYLLGLGSLCMTFQVIWSWDHQLGLFKDELLRDQPFLGHSHQHPALARSLSGRMFGSSGLAFLDTATLFVVMFQNCLQSSFLCRLGVKLTAVVGVCQGLLFVCWPLVSPDVYPSWLCRVVATAVWTAHLVHSSCVFEAALKQSTRLSEELRRALALDLKNQKDGAKADSVLNHILKNNMADAINCIELFCERNKRAAVQQHLSKASDTLFRGMWWCKLREAMLSMVAGRYTTVRTATDVHKWARDFLRGRDVGLECPREVVQMDATACSVVLENAVTNATRHGCPHDPQVKFTVEVLDGPSEGPPKTGPLAAEDAHAGRPVVVRFEVSNLANPERPPLAAPWASDGPGDALAHEASRPTLSDGLGLQHIQMVVNLCGMTARLWQRGPRVFFELRLHTQTAAAAAGTPAAAAAIPERRRPLPVGLRVLCLDDSGVARESLQHMLSAHVPGAAVATFGRNLTEVQAFKKAALAEGDVVILDQNVDVPEARVKGTDVVKELVAAGYKGFACIRSGDCTEADQALSYRSGAHWHVGKELRLRDMITQLLHQYSTFLQHRSARSTATTTPPPQEIAPSGAELPQDPGPAALGFTCSSSSSCLLASSSSLLASSSSCLLGTPTGHYGEEEWPRPYSLQPSTEPSPGLRAAATSRITAKKARGLEYEV